MSKVAQPRGSGDMLPRYGLGNAISSIYNYNIIISYYVYTFKVARYGFSRSIPPKFERKLIAISKDLEKLTPQLC